MEIDISKLKGELEVLHKKGILGKVFVPVTFIDIFRDIELLTLHEDRGHDRVYVGETESGLYIMFKIYGNILFYGHSERSMFLGSEMTCIFAGSNITQTVDIEQVLSFMGVKVKNSWLQS